ncbi:MAG: hypothetical protein ACK5JL_10235, partial [Candidatus Kapaibacterium sp.]
MNLCSTHLSGSNGSDFGFRRWSRIAQTVAFALIVGTVSTCLPVLGQDVQIDSIFIPKPTTSAVPEASREAVDTPAPTPEPRRNEPHMWFGVIGGYSHIFNTTTLAVYPNAPVCGNFSDGVADAPHYGITYEYPAHPALDISARLMYMERPSTLSLQTDNGLRAYDDVSGKDVPFIRENVFTADLRYLTLDIGLRVRPFVLLGMDLPLYVRVSADAGEPMFQNSFVQTEQIIQPTSRLFPDGTLRRTVFSGPLDDVGTAYGASGAAGLELRLSESLYFHIEAGARVGLNSVVRTQDWKVNSLYGSGQLSYGIVDP